MQSKYLVFQIEIKDYLLFDDEDGNFTGIFNVKVINIFNGQLLHVHN